MLSRTLLAFVGTLWSSRLGAATTCNSTTPSVHDTTHNIKYHGSISGGVELFQNIHFGANTGGANRFKQPSPYSYPAGSIVDATKPGDACPQVVGNPLPQFYGIYGDVASISEDCLTVRIARPKGTRSKAKLPVMVYLYGSGYNFGSIYDDVAYNPVHLVAETAKKDLPIIYVAINYRVGVFGFASSDAIRGENNTNVGLLDQYLGLQWIQENIGAFGGDKDKVTIFGQNVGWTNVQLQLTAFGGKAKPPFQRAILMSGPTSAGLLLNAGLSDITTAGLAASLKCTTGEGSAAVPDLGCLRALPLQNLTDAAVAYANAFSPLGGIGTWRPTAPSPFIPDVPSALLRDGKFHKGIDILVGWNEDDGTLFVPQDTNSDATFDTIVKTFFPGLTPAHFAKVSDDLYPVSNFAPFPSEGIDAQFYRAAQMVRDAQFACPSLRVADAFAAAHSNNVYAYSLNTSVLRHGHAQFNRSFVKTDHFSDIPYVFDTVAAAFAQVADQSDYDMASRTSGSWAAFAHFGRPAVAGHARNVTFSDWTSVSKTASLRILGGVRDGMAKIGGSYGEKMTERCGFWGDASVLAETYA